jgi:tRNA 5-methylaminomethyl-2-thiouridine biosynthesis bifunctional protein
MTLAWQDGQPFSPYFSDVYFSTESGLQETHHVFLQGNRLAERFSALTAGNCFTIGEIGFGTGLNFLCVWQLFQKFAPAGASLDYFSIEKFPLEDAELHSVLALWPELQTHAAALLKLWHRRVSGWNRWSLAGGSIRLTLAIGDVAEALPQLQAGVIDAWFLDGFSPEKNPEMWSMEVMSGIARASRSTATLATYTSAGWVRRNLQQAGFVVEKVPGFGRKREMVRATKTITRPAIKYENTSIPESVIVIGGGVAGCSAAHALAVRGVTVTLLESAPQLACGASGNPRGILHARFGASNLPLHRFVLAAYGHALALFDEILPIDGVLRDECGLLQLAFSDNERKRIARLVEQEWPLPLLQFVDAVKAKELTGIAMKHDGLWFPGGGWVVPPALCAHLANHTLIELRLSHAVNKLIRNLKGWSVAGIDATGQSWSIEAEAVIVCCAHSALALEQFSQFPLSSVRGQISMLPATSASSLLKAVVCADGYCAPAVGGVHVCGATHALNQQSIEVRLADHLDNLEKLAVHLPALRESLGEVNIKHLSGRASVRCSAPGSMPLVGRVQNGLYCSLAHGTRGLLSAGLAAETIAAMLCGHLAPLPGDILTELEPLPRKCV